MLSIVTYLLFIPYYTSMAVAAEKITLVTGGSGAIGLAIIKKLLENGAKGVAIVDLCEETGQKALEEIRKEFGSNKAIFIKTDVTNSKELESAFEKTVQTYKQLDIVINNAGIIDEINWEKTVAVNLIAVIRGSYLAIERYLPKYKSGEEGVLINTASVLGLKTVQSLPIYCVTKHGVVSLGEALGGDEYYKKYKVRVLTICPGTVRTPIIDIDPKKVVLAETAEKDLASLNAIVQSPDYVGKTVIKALQEGKSGSLWVTEEAKPAYQVVVPNRKSMCKQ